MTVTLKERNVAKQEQLDCQMWVCWATSGSGTPNGRQLTGRTLASAAALLGTSRAPSHKERGGALPL